MNYNERHSHHRDALLQFDSETHTYTHNGQIFKSVTTLVNEYFEQFNADYWAERKAPQMGLTPQQLKDLWARKGEEARNLGTQMHEKIERYYLGLPNASDDTYRLFEQFSQSHTLCPYRTEWAIFDEDSQIAGTLDFLDYQNGIFTIYDWKRSNKILSEGKPDKLNNWGKRAFKPISHIHDTTYWHYALQLSIYRYFLEKNYGILVSANKLAIFHPDYNRPYVVEVPYLRDEVCAMLNNSK